MYRKIEMWCMMMLFTAVFMTLVMAVTGCETVKGFGRDVEGVGEDIAD